jgi:holo-[acyl-carrier protein] synthase
VARALVQSYDPFMIVGIGIDMVRVDRVAGLLERRPERATTRLFSEEERTACLGRARPEECFAARFAAKEAFLKALGTGWARGIGWREVEVSAGPGSRPYLRLSGVAARRLREAGGHAVHLSFTHDGGITAAVVIIEG